MDTLVIALTGLVALADKAPAPDDIKAGWGAFGVFLGLAAATALLCWSMVRHMKKAQSNADAGAFGEDEPAKATGTTGSTGTSGPPAG